MQRKQKKTESSFVVCLNSEMDRIQMWRMHWNHDKNGKQKISGRPKGKQNTNASKVYKTKY